MQYRTMRRMALAALAVLALLPALPAANAAPTTITVPTMHCPSCAKKITAQLSAVPGVAVVQPNMPATALIVSPKPQQAPSPRAMWEAVERAGFTPAKLEGPSGTFTAKPQS